MSKISNFIDSLDYSIGKSKRKDFTFTEIKEKRNKILDDFNRNNKFLEEYIQNDSKEFPGIIFCISHVMEVYQNVSGFIDIINNPDSNTRKSWLLNTPDRGKTYFDYYDRLIEESHIKNLKDEQNVIILNIEKLLKNKFEINEMNDFLKITKELENYKAAKIKSKKVKETYTSTISSLDKIIKRTNLPIHIYLSPILKLDIYSNIDIQQSPENIVFNEFIDKLAKNIQSIDREYKYISNTIIQTKENLYNTISQLKEKTHKFAKQEGKYFKKWSLLTLDEKGERINSWINYYIYKNFYLGKIVTSESEMDNLISNLSELLNSKKISYKFIKWDTKYGIITNINGISYNNDFTFSFNGHEAEKDTSSQITSTSSKRSKSNKINLDSGSNRKIINDIILQGILRDKKLDECIEQIKTKLTLKKISSSEKTLFTKVYDDIKLIIDSNK